MGYGDWCQVSIINKSDRYLTIRDASHDDGKFYDSPDKDKEVDSKDLNGTVIKPGDTKSIAGCGREDAAVGVDAKFSLFDGESKAAEIHFSCPYSGDNSFSVDCPSTSWLYNMRPANISTGGAIGSVTLNLAYVA